MDDSIWVQSKWLRMWYLHHQDLPYKSVTSQTSLSISIFPFSIKSQRKAKNAPYYFYNGRGWVGSQWHCTLSYSVTWWFTSFNFWTVRFETYKMFNTVCRRLQNVLNNEIIILVIWILGQCNGQIWQHKTRILVMRIREWSIWFSSATTYHLGGTLSPFWRIWENGPLMTVWVVRDECIK